jgi:hypothetical protein
MRGRRAITGAGALALALALIPADAAGADDESSVSGALIGNGETIELPYVYIYEKQEGFYDESDPAWELVFAAEPIEERDLDDFFHEFPYVKLSITLTNEFGDGDEPTYEVYAQNIRLSPEGTNLSGGTYPEIEWESTGPEVFAGRAYIPEMQEFFDDTYQYDFTFSATLSDPDRPIGEALPADGGEPGRAYLAWVEAIQALDVERLKSMVPPEMAEMLDAEDAMENLELMRLMSPSSIKILGGSSDGSSAILQVIGVMDGEENEGEVELAKHGEHWIPVSTSWK